ncbi:MAG TPA: peptidylprolyl isomerase [Ignavibacteriaceae bacterium]|nr:peptidylprolyl isomerase [Ignavibacteriaceae bacterium]
MYSCILLCLTFLLASPGISKNKDTQGPSNDKVLASVGSHTITLNEFSSRYTDYLIGAGINDNNIVRESILLNMINEVLLYNYDTNSSIFSNSEYQRELEAARKETILAYLKDQEVYKNITASDDEIREAFVRANEKIAARHLYAKSKEEADELYELLKIGVSFDDLAKQVFTDSVLKNNGGYLGYFTWGDMDPAFEDAAYSMKIGEISKPVKTVYGYSIIKVEDKVTRPLLTENEYLNKKDHLSQVVRMRKMKPFEREYVKSIIDPDKIKFNEKGINNIFSDLSLAASTEFKTPGTGSNGCASYEGKKYLQFDMEREINQLPLYQKNKINNIENLKAVIKGLILRDTLFNIASDKGYDTIQVVNDTFNKLTTDLFMKYKTMEVLKNTQVADSIVYKYYKDNITSFLSPREINAKELIVDKKQLADSLKMLAVKGADFNMLIEQHSLQNNRADGNGEFSEIDKYGFLKDTLWNTTTGEIAGPFKIENYFVLFQVVGKKDGKPMDYDSIKNRVTNAVKKEMSRSLMNNYADNLKKSVKIKINYEVLWDYKISGLSSKSKLN